MKKVSLFLAVWVMIVMTCFGETSDKKTVTAQLVTQDFIYNGIKLNQRVIVYDDTTYVPIKVLGEMLGVSVTLNDDCLIFGGADSVKKKMMISSYLKVNMSINADYCTLAYKGENATGQTPVIIYDGTAYMPIRVFGEQVHTNVSYKNGIIIIGSENKPVIDKSHSNNTSTPVPMGKEQVVTTQNRGINCTAKICVKEVYRGEEALKRLRILSESNLPKEGQEYVVAKMTFEVISVDFTKGTVSSINSVPNTDKYMLGTNNFHSYDSNNNAIPEPKVGAPSPMLSGILTNGDNLEGWNVFIVNIDDKSPKILYGESYKDGQGGTWFSIQP